MIVVLNDDGTVRLGTDGLPLVSESDTPTGSCCCANYEDCVVCITGTATAQVKLTVAGIVGAYAGYNGVYFLDASVSNPGNDICEWLYEDADIFANFTVINDAPGVFFNTTFDQKSPFLSYSLRNFGWIGSFDVPVDCSDIPELLVTGNSFGADFDNATFVYEFV